MRTLGLVISAFCMATVLALAAGAGYLIATGRLDRVKAARIVAVMHGLELVPEPAVEARQTGAPGLQGSDALVIRSQQLDLRERFIDGQHSELDAERRKLMAERTQLAQDRDALKKERSAWEEGEKAEGIEQAVRLIGNLPPDQAKQQILEFWTKGEIDWVVTLMRNLAEDRRTKIAREFTTPEDVQKLAEITRRIRDGQPPLGKMTNDEAPMTKE
jgi:hypothetical protein